MESSFEELKRYVRFSAEDAALVAKLAPIAEPHFGRIARAFYDRIREHEDAHAVFTGEEQIQRQHASLVRWMKRLLSGKYDEAYFAESFKIGHAHVRVGLPQRYVFSAMALIRIELERLTDALGADAVPHHFVAVSTNATLLGWRLNLTFVNTNPPALQLTNGLAFCGTLAAQLAHGETTADAVRWASAAGALATTRSGAVPSLPDRDSVERLVRDGS